MNQHRSFTENNDDALLDQLVEQFTARVRAGEVPSIHEYQEKHPALKIEIHELLSSVAMIEGLKQQSVTSTSDRSKFEQIDLKQIGEYRIVRELGRGGMGIVFEAIHDSLGRRVAIKVLPSRLLDNEKYVERFTREARAAAKLHHNNIVSVFGVGHSDGLHYYVMEFIDGKPLNSVINGLRAHSIRPSQATQIQPTLLDHAQLGTLAGDSDFQLSSVRGNPPRKSSARTASLEDSTEIESDHLPPRFSMPSGNDRFVWAANVIADIADALQYAHEQGVLHRDVKPGNLILDPNGRVWLTDFGLVKNVGNQTMTVAGEVIGTPRYMAPESFEGRYNVPSETFCLGTTLYELVTLQPVCEEASPAETIRTITSSTATRPRKIDARIPRDLETIIEKAISSHSVDRYQSAATLRDDLRSFALNRPIAARSASLSKRVWLWCKRNPWQTVSAALFAIAAVVATTGFIDRSNSLSELAEQNEQLTIERDNTKKARDEAERNAIQLREQFERAEANIALSNEWLDAMIRQLVRPGSKKDEQFSFDSYRELSGVETTVSPKDVAYLENMLGFVGRFAEQNSDNKELAVEAGRAFRRVANIYHLLGQKQAASTAYKDAIRFYDSLLKRQPDAAFAIDQIQTANELTLLLLTNREQKKAAEAIERTIKMIHSSDFTEHLELQLELLRTLNLKGTSAPIDVLEIGDAWLASLDHARPGNERRERRGLLPRRRVMKMARENLEALTEAIELSNQLIEEHGQRPELVLERSKSQARQAEIYFGLREFEDGKVAKQEALRNLIELCENNPNVPDYREVLAQTYAIPIGEELETILGQLQRASELTSQLCDELPENPSYSQLNAEVNFQLGQLLEEGNNKSKAIACFKTALDSMLNVYERAPRNQQIRLRLNLAINASARLLIEQKEFEQAEEILLDNLSRFRGGMEGEFRGNSLTRTLFIRQLQLLLKCHEALGERTRAIRVARRIQELRIDARKDRAAKPRNDKSSKD